MTEIELLEIHANRLSNRLEAPMERLGDIFQRIKATQPDLAQEIESVALQIAKARLDTLKELFQTGHAQRTAVAERNGENSAKPLDWKKLQQCIDARRNDQRIKNPQLQWGEDLARRVGLSSYRLLKERLKKMGVSDEWIETQLTRQK